MCPRRVLRAPALLAILCLGASGQILPKEVSRRKSEAPEQAIPHCCGDSVVAESLRYLGTPYVFGGTDMLKGVDTSRFVAGVYRRVGLPELAAPVHNQERFGQIVHWRKGRAERGGKTVEFPLNPPSLDSLHPGDRLIFQLNPTKQTSEGHHTGIYIGRYRAMEHAFVHASAGRGVAVSELKPGTRLWTWYRYALRDIPWTPPPGGGAEASPGGTEKPAQ